MNVRASALSALLSRVILSPQRPRGVASGPGNPQGLGARGEERDVSGTSAPFAAVGGLSVNGSPFIGASAGCQGWVSEGNWVG